MNMYFGWIAAAAVAAVVASAPLHRRDAGPGSVQAASPCAADSSFQRLAFWIGDWDVYDSTGAHYATQRVSPVLDSCAISVEWASGGGNKGMSLSAFDQKTGVWNQIYASNQLPSPAGVKLRKSDASYAGPGVRFIALTEGPATNPFQSRVTIMPLSGHRALQEFEDTRDGGKTWQVVFKAEHRLRTTAP